MSEPNQSDGSNAFPGGGSKSEWPVNLQPESTSRYGDSKFAWAVTVPRPSSRGKLYARPALAGGGYDLKTANPANASARLPQLDDSDLYVVRIRPERPLAERQVTY